MKIFNCQFSIENCVEAGAAPVAEVNVSTTSDLLCGGCGYNLRGGPETSDRCPECGRRFDRNHLVGNLVAWEQRKSIGRVKAFFKTVWVGTVHVATLAEKAKWPVSGPDARWFRVIVLVLASATLALGAGWWLGETPVDEPKMVMARGYLEGELAAWIFVLNPWSFSVLAASILIWLIACACVVTSFFYDRRLSEAQQKRAVALSCYSSAALAWLPAAVPVGALMIGLSGALRSPSPLPAIGNGVQLICWLAFVVQAISWMRWRRQGERRGGRLRAIFALITLAGTGAGFALVWWEWYEWNRPMQLFRNAMVPAIAALMLIGTVMMLFWVNVLRLLRATTQASGWRVARVGVGLLVAWGLLGIMIIGTAQAMAVMGQVLWAAW